MQGIASGRNCIAFVLQFDKGFMPRMVVVSREKKNAMLSGSPFLAVRMGFFPRGDFGGWMPGADRFTGSDRAG